MSLRFRGLYPRAFCLAASLLPQLLRRGGFSVAGCGATAPVPLPGARRAGALPPSGSRVVAGGAVAGSAPAVLPGHVARAAAPRGRWRAQLGGRPAPGLAAVPVQGGVRLREPVQGGVQLASEGGAGCGQPSRSSLPERLRCGTEAGAGRGAVAVERGVRPLITGTAVSGGSLRRGRRARGPGGAGGAAGRQTGVCGSEAQDRGSPQGRGVHKGGRARRRQHVGRPLPAVACRRQGGGFVFLTSWFLRDPSRQFETRQGVEVARSDRPGSRRRACGGSLVLLQNLLMRERQCSHLSE